MDSNRPFGNDFHSNLPPHASSSSNDIVVAEVVSPPSRGRGLFLFLMCGGSLALVLVVGVIVGVYLFVSKTNEHLSSELLTKTGDAKWRMVQEGFSGHVDEFSAKERAAIEKTIGNVMFYGSKDDFSSVVVMVDEDGFMDQVDRSGFTKLGFLQRVLIENDFDLVTDGPVGYDHYKVAGIKQRGDDEAIVFLYLWDEGDDLPAEFIWWMRKTETVWKVIDWEPLWHSMSEASQYAILTNGMGTPGVDNFYEWIDEIEEAETARDGGDLELAKERMNRTSRRIVDPELNGVFEINNALFWFSLGEYESTLKRLDRILQPDQHPTVYLLKAQCLAGLGRKEEAITMLDKYSQLIGFSPAATSLKADYCSDLGRDDDAIDQWVSLARQIPDHPVALRRLAGQIPAERVGELGEIISQMDDPPKQAMDIALRLYRHDQTPVIEEMIRVVDENGGDPVAGALLKSIALRLDWEYESAAQSFLNAVTLATDDRQEELQNEYLDLMLTMARPLEGYQNAPNKADAFLRLSNAYDEGEYDFPIDQFKQMVQEHALTHPQSVWLSYYLASFLSKEKKYEQAIAMLDQGILNVGANDAESAIPAYLRAKTSAYLKLDQPLDGYRDVQGVQKKQDAFQQVAFYLSQEKDFETLRLLVEEHRQLEPESEADSREAQLENSQWIEFYDAILNYQDGEHDAAIEQVVHVMSELPFFRRYQIRNKLCEWLVENDRWQSYLKENAIQGDEDADAMFTLIHSQLLETGSEDEMAMLLSIHRENGFAAADRLVWRCEDALSTKSDPQRVQVFGGLSEAEWKEIPEYSRARYRREWLNALLRRGDFAKARDVATNASEPSPSSRSLFDIAVAVGDEAACRELLENQDGSDLYYSNFVSGVEAKKFLEGSEFAKLRKDFPISALDVYCPQLIQILYESNPPSVSEIQNGLVEHFGEDFDFAPMKIDASTGVQSVVGSNAEKTVVASLVASQVELYGGEVDLPEHSHVLTVTVRQIGELSPEKDGLLARRLFSESSVGVFYERSQLLLTRPFTNTDRDSSDVFSGKQTNDVYLYLDPEEKGDPYWEKMRRSYQRVEEMKRTPDGKWEVLVEHSLGTARESHWFPVERIELEGDVPVIVVIRDQPIELFPSLQTGEPMLVSIGKVVDWREKK